MRIENLPSWTLNYTKRLKLYDRCRRRAQRWGSPIFALAADIVEINAGTHGNVARREIASIRAKQRRHSPPMRVHVVSAFDPLQGYRCCPKAGQVFCVCRVKTTCPDHGDRCHGSHD